MAHPFHILDTSVIIKWFSEEENHEKALFYLTQIQNGEIRVLVPSLFFYEFGNALLSKNLSSSAAKEFVKQLFQLELLIAEMSKQDIAAIYKISQTYHISFYDGAYVYLAKKRNCAFVTADKKLFLKIQKDFPKAHLL